MAANIQPIFPNVPRIGKTKIGTTSAQVKSDGTSSGASTDLMYCTFISGANGSFLQRIRFSTVASAAATNSVATVLRIYYSTIVTAEGAAAGATTAADTHLIAEISVPIISSSHSTLATNYYEVPLNIPIPATKYIMVSQHIAQTTNQQWQAIAIGGDY